MGIMSRRRQAQTIKKNKAQKQESADVKADPKKKKVEPKNESNDARKS